MCLMVFNGLYNYLDRFGSIWTKFLLKLPILHQTRDIQVNWAHGAHGLLGWGTTYRELTVPSGITPEIQGTIETTFCRMYVFSSPSTATPSFLTVSKGYLPSITVECVVTYLIEPMILNFPVPRLRDPHRILDSIMVKTNLFSVI